MKVASKSITRWHGVKFFYLILLVMRKHSEGISNFFLPSCDLSHEDVPSLEIASTTEKACIFFGNYSQQSVSLSCIFIRELLRSFRCAKLNLSIYSTWCIVVALATTYVVLATTLLVAHFIFFVFISQSVSSRHRLHISLFVIINQCEVQNIKLTKK